jgi:hypothetical protein
MIGIELFYIMGTGNGLSRVFITFNHNFDIILGRVLLGWNFEANIVMVA